MDIFIPVVTAVCIVAAAGLFLTALLRRDDEKRAREAVSHGLYALTGAAVLVGIVTIAGKFDQMFGPFLPW